MNLKTKLGLLLVPDLRTIVKKLEEVEKGLEVAQDWVDRVKPLGDPDVDGGGMVVGVRSMASEASHAIVESRARLMEVMDELTGRGIPTGVDESRGTP